jgi:hypothetical protein
MFTQIKFSRSIRSILRYNEKKVECGQAQLIHAGNFLQRTHEMKWSNKMERFENLLLLNERAKVNAIHSSLSFHPSEKERLDKELLSSISDRYMLLLGFGKQPYLVYEHHDAAHPHLHIVSTLIRSDGCRMNTNDIVTFKAERTRRDLENEYDLVKANKTGRTPEQEKLLKAETVKVHKLQFGRSGTTFSIVLVLEKVDRHYRYTSLPEFNTILQQFNVMAARTHADNMTGRKEGLIYFILDDEGRTISTPVKASRLDSKYSLANLEKRFLENKQAREPSLKRLRNAIDWTLAKTPTSLATFTRELEKERVSAVFSRYRKTSPDGLIYIDHRSGSVVSEEGLGKEYSAKCIFEKLGIQLSMEKKQEREHEPEREHDQKKDKEQTLELHS